MAIQSPRVISPSGATVPPAVNEWDTGDEPPVIPEPPKGETTMVTAPDGTILGYSIPGTPKWDPRAKRWMPTDAQFVPIQRPPQEPRGRDAAAQAADWAQAGHYGAQTDYLGQQVALAQAKITLDQLEQMEGSWYQREQVALARGNQEEARLAREQQQRLEEQRLGLQQQQFALQAQLGYAQSRREDARYGLSQGELTGYYGDRPTLARDRFDADRALQAAQLALQQGNQAEARRQFDIAQGLRERVETGQLDLARQNQGFNQQLQMAQWQAQQRANPASFLDVAYGARGMQAPVVQQPQGGSYFGALSMGGGMPSPTAWGMPPAGKFVTGMQAPAAGVPPGQGEGTTVRQPSAAEQLGVTQADMDRWARQNGTATRQA